jgi:plasmid stabilization system protein ParE
VAVEIEFSPQARTMLDEADERWIAEHGFEADNPLLDEVADAANLLRETPELGVLYAAGRFHHELRRLLLRSGWHVYYSFDRGRNAVVIVAVWYAARGTGPPI